VAIAFVQTNSGNTSSGTTLDVTLNGVTAGNLVVLVSLRTGSTDRTLTTKDNTNNIDATVAVPELVLSIAGAEVAIDFIPNAVGGNTTYRLTASGSTALTLRVYEFSGFGSTANPLDAFSSIENSSGTSHLCATTGNIDTTTNVAVIFGLVLSGNPNGGSLPSGYTSTDGIVRSGYKVSATALADENGSQTSVTARSSVGAIASFSAKNPLNLTAPVLNTDGTVDSGTWNSQSNGAISRETKLYLASNDSLIATLSGADPDFSGDVTAGLTYYVVERASNDGGYDPAEDTPSADTTIVGGGGPNEGSGSVTGVGAVTGAGSTVRSGSGSIDSVGLLTGAGAKVSSGSGSITSVGLLTGAGQSTRNGSGSVAGIGELDGVGFAPVLGPASGFGSVVGVGLLTGAGSTTRSGSGSIDAIGVLTGVGLAPVTDEATGIGTVSGVGLLTGAGTTTRQGFGSVAAIDSIIGTGSTTRSGSGSLDGVGLLSGAGPSSASSSSMYYYLYLAQ
jgi:hypothetical protein